MLDQPSAPPLNPQPLSLHLVMDEVLVSSLRADLDVATMLDSYIIDSKPMADLANADMRASITRIAEIKAAKAKFVEPAKTIICNAEAFFDPSIDARMQFVSGLRQKLTVYTQEQQRLADEARRRREAEEREARQRAEAAAAAARAKADEEAAALRRQAEAAEAARQKALAEGNARAAAKAAADSAKLAEKAQAAVENGEVRAAQAEMAVQAAVPIAVPVVEKVAGFGLRDNWKGELAVGTTPEQALMLIVAEISGVSPMEFRRIDLLALMKLDMSAADRLAKALKKAFNVPGMQAVNRQTSVSRAA